MTNKKIAVGIINLFDNDTFQKCKKSIPSYIDYVFDVHHTLDNIKTTSKDIYRRYISYGGLRNILLRQIVETDADYIFLINSNMAIQDPTIFQDYIKTAKLFGTWFMSKRPKTDKSITIEDDSQNINICLHENLTNDFIFLLKSHVKHCGYFHEGFINFSGKDDSNCLEIYDFYNKLQDKINYLPKGYFPDVELSLAKIVTTPATLNRPEVKQYTTDNITKVYAQFYNKNKFIPGQHKTETAENALLILEKIQNIYGSNI